ncbi:MAG: ABC transporter ATP-binding protein [Anaerolineales bacterium]|nr:ABC transporter ATP-binding protein [Anaerolineales bacterium]
MFGKRDENANGSNGAIIRLNGVVKEYHGLAGDVTALRGIDLQVQQGEFLVVTGKSGAGKTTLINMITGLDRSTAGEIWVTGAALHRMGAERVAGWRGRHVGVVFQSFELLPTLSMLQNVTLPMDFAGRFSERERRERGMRLLEQVGIAEHAHKPPSAISGGQQQRVAIARAMANDPPILAADEPTGSLDSLTAGAVLEIFKELVAQGKTIVLATHDRDIALRAGRVIELYDGQIIGREEVDHA